MPGKFIVLEGIDGSGCGTQSEILEKKLNAKLSTPALFLKYPDYADPLGKSIHMFLHGKLILDASTQFLLYALNMIKDMYMIKQALKSNRLVIADRYFVSSLAYQSSQGLSQEKALKFADLFNLIKPNLVIYLRVDPHLSFERKKKEKKDLDKWEKNIGFQKKVSKKYDALARKKVFAKKWVVIDGKKSIEEVAEEIWKAVTNELKV